MTDPKSSTEYFGAYSVRDEENSDSNFPEVYYFHKALGGHICTLEAGEYY